MKRESRRQRLFGIYSLSIQGLYAAFDRWKAINSHLLLLLLYLIPVLLMSIAGLCLGQKQAGWKLFASGLLMASIGSVIGWLLIKSSKSLPPAQPTRTSLTNNSKAKDEPIEEAAATEGSSPSDEQQERYCLLLQEEKEEVKKLRIEYELLQRNWENTKAEYHNSKVDWEAQFADIQNILKEYQQTICLLRQQENKYQVEIGTLEAKIQELSGRILDQEYEIKTILAINGEAVTPPPAASTRHADDSLERLRSYKNGDDKPIATLGEALLEMQRCVLAAQKISASTHLPGAYSRWKESAPANLTMELRRLFELFAPSRHAVILIHSIKEEKVVFVNQAIKDLLGWGPEKFIQDFSDICSWAAEEWDKTLRQINKHTYAQTRAIFKAKSGKETLCHLCLSRIPTGIFTDYLVGIAYPD